MDTGLYRFSSVVKATIDIMQNVADERRPDYHVVFPRSFAVPTFVFGKV